MQYWIPASPWGEETHKGVSINNVESDGFIGISLASAWNNRIQQTNGNVQLQTGGA
jgi:hypothetical protein